MWELLPPSVVPLPSFYTPEVADRKRGNRGTHWDDGGITQIRFRYRETFGAERGDVGGVPSRQVWDSPNVLGIC